MNALSRHKTIVYLMAVFVMGVIAGGAFGVGLARRPFFRPPTQAEVARNIVADLTRELELTPDQLQQVRPVIENAARQIHEVHKRAFDEVKQIVHTADREIGKFLTPVQQQRLEEMHRKRARRGPGGPPHGPPGDGPPGGPRRGPPGDGPPHGCPPPSALEPGPRAGPSALDMGPSTGPLP